MTNTIYKMNEPDFIDNPPNLFADSSSIADDGEGLYPCPVFNSNFSFEEGIFHGFISSLCGTEEDDFTSRRWNENGLIEDYYEEEQTDYGDHWNWSSCFSDWQHENFYSLEDGTHDIGCGSILGKMEDYSLGEEQHDNYFSYHEDTDNQFVIDYNPWYACRGEEDSHDYGRQQPITAYDYNLDDMGLCEGIFGYWPCLFRQKPRISRECAEDCKVNGSFVKGKSRVLINIYAMMRDPELWTNLDEFIPGRFLESSDEKISEHQMEFKGQNFRYIPFGSGRRGCPGASLAMLVMHTTIAALVQRFDWTMKGRENVDLSVGSGFGAEIEKPLVCYRITRLT